MGNHVDEWRRSLRACEDPWPLENKDDGALCEVGAAAYRQDSQHSAGSVEVFERATPEAKIKQTDVRVLFARENFYSLVGGR